MKCTVCWPAKEGCKVERKSSDMHTHIGCATNKGFIAAIITH